MSEITHLSGPGKAVLTRLELADVLPEHQLALFVVNAHGQHVGGFLQADKGLSRAATTALTKTARHSNALTDQSGA